jgi:hypothetical protein
VDFQATSAPFFEQKKGPLAGGPENLTPKDAGAMNESDGQPEHQYPRGMHFNSCGNLQKSWPVILTIEK